MAYSYTAAHHHELQPTDDRVVVIVRNGDAEAFGVLVERHHSPLTRHLAYRLGDPELSADLAQDVFLDIFRQLDRIGAIMQVDLNDPDTRLRLHLALHVRLALAA